MVCEAETHKKLEVLFGIVNDCFDMLCKAETRYDVICDSLMLVNTFMIQYVNLNV